MKFLIAGLGSIGRRHLRNLLANDERDIVLYRTHHATLPDDEIRGFPVETDLRAALSHKPDAVIVSNPTALHLDVAIPAAQSGCHLLLEKPISHTLENVDALQDAASRNGISTLVGFQFRFHPGIRTVKGWLETGAIGVPLSVRAYWGEYLPDWHPWEDYRNGYAARPDLGGGVILTLCHPLDYLRMLLGEVQSLTCTTSNTGLKLPVEDAAEIGLQFENGVIGSVHLNYNQRPPRHDLEIVGTEGTIRWDNADGIARCYRATAGEWEIVSPPKNFERNDLFRDETANFLGMLRGETDSACSLEDGVRALKICHTARKAASTGTRISL